MQFDKAIYTRRRLLEKSGLGFGSLTLAYLLKENPLCGAVSEPSRALFSDLKPRAGHFKGPAKAMVQLFQNGGPSQVDLFDPKPELNKRSGETITQQVETFQPGNKNVLLGSAFQFKRYGQCGMEMSDAVPRLGGVADELCLIRSMYTEHNNHPEGVNMMETCKIFAGRPVMGAWISSALGAENQNLPAYVVLRDPAGYNSSGKMAWSSGFLPSLYQGVEFSSAGTPVHHLNPANPLPPGAQRGNLDLLAKFNKLHQQEHPREKELDARIQNYELAARMQLAATEVLDLSKESDATRKLYGLDNPLTADYGKRCLMARRLIEAGVRFVQIFPPVASWDHHNELRQGLQSMCAQCDQGSAALIQDLKARGLLDSTAVMWTGEFGRLPITQNGSGRDHNRYGFSLLMAGGGFKPGFVYGETDELGYKGTVNRVGVPDLQATVLAAMGIDPQQVDVSIPRPSGDADRCKGKRREGRDRAAQAGCLAPASHLEKSLSRQVYCGRNPSSRAAFRWETSG
jgi:hypothetical protein